MAKGERAVLRTSVWWALWLMALSGCACDGRDSAQPQGPSDVAGIHIDYQYVGWGTAEEKFTLLPELSGQGFVLKGRYVDSRGMPHEVERFVPRVSVESFVAAAVAPPWPRAAGVRAMAARVDRREVSRIEPYVRLPPMRCTHDEIRQLARLHVRREGRVALVDAYYGLGISWTDDYPYALVQVHRRDGGRIVMHSSSQKARMLPWHVGEPAESIPASGEDWSPSLSEALRLLVPPGSRLHERLDGIAMMQSRLGNRVAHHAERNCDAMRPVAAEAAGGSGTQRVADR